MNQPIQPFSPESAPDIDPAIVAIETEEAPGILERALDRIPPGMPGPLYVYGALAVGSAASLITRSKEPIETVVRGIGVGTIGNSLNSGVGHRQGAHESIQTSPKTNEVLRFATSLLGGVRIKAVAMHLEHHPTSDTEADPHAPMHKGRWEVFSGLIGITQKFEEDHPELIEPLQDSEYTKNKWYEGMPTLIAGTLAVHTALGKARGRSNLSIAASTGLHFSLIYLQNVLYTADVHPQDADGEIQNFDYDPFVNGVLGSESNHRDHHEDPGNPRLSDYDLVFAAARGLRRLGLAKMPRLDEQEAAIEADS